MPYILGHESAAAWSSGEDIVGLYWFNDDGGELTGEYEHPMVVAKSACSPVLRSHTELAQRRDEFGRFGYTEATVLQNARNESSLMADAHCRLIYRPCLAFLCPWRKCPALYFRPAPAYRHGSPTK